jgi:hypothetical protein
MGATAAGMGDLDESLDADAPWRHRQPHQTLMPHGELGLTLGIVPGLLTQRLKARAGTELFVGDDLRLSLEILGDGLWSQPGGALLPADFFRVQRAFVEWRSPLGALFFGRMPLHFGMGILHHAGTHIDDAPGDRVDQVGWAAPFADHVLGVSAAWAAGSAHPFVLGARPHRMSDDARSLTFSLSRQRAPWVERLHLQEDRTVGAYAFRLVGMRARADSQSIYDSIAPALLSSPATRVPANQWGGLLNASFSLSRRSLRLEGEGFAGFGRSENISPLPGAQLRNRADAIPLGGVIAAEGHFVVCFPGG